MNREILFRGKRIDNGKWVEGCLLIDYITGQYFIHAYGNSVNESDKVDEEGGLKFFAFEVFSETVGRYTGLNDKNNRKIFERDIVKIPYERLEDSICEVVFKRGMFLGELRDGCEDSINRRKEDVEVIGNIFDNPELIN